jgi:hypothetical protein
LRQDSKDISRELVQAFGISPAEAELYLESLSGRVIKERLLAEHREMAETVNSLMARGMLIRASSGKKYLPVHPRLALSNLFRAYEEGLLAQRRQRRLVADRLTLELIPIFEESKNTNPSRVRGHRNERAQA